MRDIPEPGGFEYPESGQVGVAGVGAEPNLTAVREYGANQV